MLDFKECITEIKKIKTKSYCLIVGGQGTNNARSPKIWNRVLKKNKIDCKMIPLEVKKKDLNKLLYFLKNDSKFLGGAVAVPYKENVYKYLENNLDIFTKKIGSVNCLYKENTLRGINTDGLGFLETLKKHKINKNYKNIILLGFGGVGKSTLVYLKKFFSKKTNIYCSTRKNYSKKINNLGCIWINWKTKEKIFDKLNMIINATTLGYGNLNTKSPIKITKSKELKLIYDIIYKPKNTLLIKNSKKLNIKTINGLEMNMLQALFAIKKVFKNKVVIKNRLY